MNGLFVYMIMTIDNTLLSLVLIQYLLPTTVYFIYNFLEDVKTQGTVSATKSIPG